MTDELQAERNRASKAERELHQQRQANAALTSERNKLQAQQDADTAVAAFRARCGEIMAAPGASARYQQAAAFAVETDVPADVARETLVSLPTDAAAGLAPGASAIGAGAQVKDKIAAVGTERARIGAILTCPEAQGREATAIAYALKSVLSAEMAIGLLGRMAKVARPQSIAEREAGMNSFGPGGFGNDFFAKPSGASDLWARARARVGAETETPILNPDDHQMGPAQDQPGFGFRKE